MKRCLLFLLFTALLANVQAQQVDSIYFHLYTDSLKKGTHNYINVDGKLSDGRWMPLTAKELQLTSNYGRFEGNDLVLPALPVVDKVTVKAVLISNPALWRETTIWIKTLPDPELPGKDDVLKKKRK